MIPSLSSFKIASYFYQWSPEAATLAVFIEAAALVHLLPVLQQRFLITVPRLPTSIRRAKATHRSVRS